MKVRKTKMRREASRTIVIRSAYLEKIGKIEKSGKFRRFSSVRQLRKALEKRNNPKRGYRDEKNHP